MRCKFLACLSHAFTGAQCGRSLVVQLAEKCEDELLPQIRGENLCELDEGTFVVELVPVIKRLLLYDLDIFGARFRETMGGNRLFGEQPT